MPIQWRTPESGTETPFDTANCAVSLAYDVVNRGVIICITTVTAGSSSGTHWWFDWETKSFWKMVFGSPNHEPLCLHARVNYVPASAAESTVLFGCRDGYIRRLENDRNSDDSTDFDSYCWFGPFGDPSLFGDTIAQELMIETAKDSGDVKWQIFVGDTAQEAFESVAREDGILEAGRNPPAHPMARGQAIYLKLSNVDAVGWGYEGGYMILRPAGRTRV